MYTHSVISQRSPNWFYFLVKPTSLHTTSPAPVSAIQMYIQSAGHPKRFIPMMLLFLFSFFSCSKVKYFFFGISYALLWPLKERKFLFLTLTLEIHEGRGTVALSEVASRMQEDNQIHTADGKMAPKIIVLPKLWQHVNISTPSKAWHPGRKNANSGEEDAGTSSLTFEKIRFKFTAYVLWHSVVCAELFWRSGPF